MVSILEDEDWPRKSFIEVAQKLQLTDSQGVMTPLEIHEDGVKTPIELIQQIG